MEKYIVDNNLMQQLIEYNHNKYLDFKEGVVSDKVLEFERILCARYMKVSRVKKRLVWLLSRFKYVYFVTFTFDNKRLNQKEETRRKLIKKTLEQIQGAKWILNIDYGSKTEREHYHCIVGLNNLDLDGDLISFLLTNKQQELSDIYLDYKLKTIYPCFVSAERIGNKTEDIKKLSKYIDKLSNHCLKSSTYNSRIVYNFKGYDIPGATWHDKFVAYHMDLIKLGVI